MTQRFTVKAECGLAVPVAQGQRLRVINTFGTQVVDTWAIAADDPSDYLSMEHCREVIQRIVFEPGDVLMTNHYRPILKILADTSPGGHDTLIAACSEPMYRRAGAAPGHASCAGNLATALASQGERTRPHAAALEPVHDRARAGRPLHRVSSAHREAG